MTFHFTRHMLMKFIRADAVYCRVLRQSGERHLEGRVENLALFCRG